MRLQQIFENDNEEFILQLHRTKLKGKQLPPTYKQPDGRPVKVSECYAKDVYIQNNPNLVNLINCPKRVTSIFVVEKNNTLESLEGAPLWVHGMFLNELPNLSSLKYIPDIKTGLRIGNCALLENFKYIPKGIRSLYIHGNMNNIKNISHLWDTNIKNISLDETFKMKNEVYEALKIFHDAREQGIKNYIQVVKMAREQGLEDFFV